MKKIALLLVILSIISCKDKETKQQTEIEVVEIVEVKISKIVERATTTKIEKDRYTPLVLKEHRVNGFQIQYRADSLSIDVNQDYEQQDQNYLEVAYGKKIIGRHTINFFEGVEDNLILFHSTLDDNYILLLEHMYEYSSAYYIFKIDNEGIVLCSEFRVEIASDEFYDYQYRILEEDGFLILKIYDNSTNFLRIEKLCAIDG